MYNKEERCTINEKNYKKNFTHQLTVDVNVSVFIYRV